MERWKQERANCGKGEKCRKSKRLEKPNWEVKSIQDIGFEGSQKEIHLEENIVGFQSFFFSSCTVHTWEITRFWLEKDNLFSLNLEARGDQKVL